jgi:hypothetical protein
VTPSSEAAATESAARLPAPAVALDGRWRVAGIDDAGLDEDYGIAIAADARKIWWEPLCAGFSRGYRITGQRFETFADPHRPRSATGEPTRPDCVIAPPPRVADVMRALDAGETIARTPANGVLISGGGHSVLLFSQ